MTFRFIFINFIYNKKVQIYIIKHLLFFKKINFINHLCFVNNNFFFHFLLFYLYFNRVLAFVADDHHRLYGVFHEATIVAAVSVFEQISGLINACWKQFFMYKDLIIDSVNKYIIAYRDKNDVLDKKNKEKLKSVPNPSFTNYYKSIKFVFIEAMKTTIKTIFAFDTCFVFRFEKLPSFLIYNPVNNEIEFSFVVHASS